MLHLSISCRERVEDGCTSSREGRRMEAEPISCYTRPVDSHELDPRSVASWTQIGEWTALVLGEASPSRGLPRRAARPLPDRATLTLAQEWQCRIVGGALLAWLREHGPNFLQERAAMARLLEVDPDPAIVFTADVPGLVAAQEILGSDHQRVVFLLKEEFADAEPRAADPGYVRYVHVWSRFLPELERDFAAQARSKHPIPASSEYWQHAEGTMWAPNAGLGVDHLWRWDGKQPELLGEAMTHWVA